MLLVDAGHTGCGPDRSPSDIAFWLLASIATLITLSLGRFVLFGLPSMVDGWYQEHKNWIYTLIGGGRALRGVLFDVSGPIRNPFWGSLAGTLLPRRRGTRRRFGRPGQSGAVAEERGRPIFLASVAQTL